MDDAPNVALETLSVSKVKLGLTHVNGKHTFCLVDAVATDRTRHVDQADHPARTL